MVETWCEVERSKDGLRYQVRLADFGKRKLFQEPEGGELMTFEAAGLKVTKHIIDGVPVEPPEAPKADEKK